MNTQFDVVIVGGGLVGAAAAVALKLQGHHVALIDKALPSFSDNNTDEWDSRIYAISPANVAWLEALGVWQMLDSSRVCSVTQMQIWGDETTQPLQLDAYQSNVANLSDIIESAPLQNALWQRMQALEVEVILATPQALSFDNDAACLQLADNKTISAKLLLAADGGQSWVRSQAGVEVYQHDYDQLAVVANFGIELAHQNVAKQWFKQEGVLAWLPLAGKHMSMVWSTTREHAKHLLALDAKALAEEVAAAGQYQLGQLSLLTQAVAFPLKRQDVSHLAMPNLALIGDAAHLVHPLAGQGVNLGFRDVIALVNVLSKRGHYQSLGDLMLLREYERSRKQDILAIKGITHGLGYLFQQHEQWVKKIRNFGIETLNQSAELKKHLIKQAIA